MKKEIISFSCFALLFFSSCHSTTMYRLFSGGYAKPGEKGLSIFDFNKRTGNVALVAAADVGPDPSYFCFSKKNSLLYVANEVMEFNGEAGGGLTTYKYSPQDASFEKRNEIVIPHGGPCFISMSPDSGYLFLANYPKGSVVVVKLNNEGLPGSITDTILYVRSDPRSSHAHMIKGDPSGKIIYVSDLGQDLIFRYNFNTEDGTLSALDTLSLPKGSGPRHFDFSHDGSMFYLINELGSTISVFDVSGKPALIQTVPTTREGFVAENACADPHVSNDGKFIYGSNRGENTIVTFAIQADGTLKLAGHKSCGGNWPRNFTLDPSGGFILVGNEKSDSMAVFRLDKKTGLPLEPAKNYKVTSPACLKFY